jgi:integrase
MGLLTVKKIDAAKPRDDKPYKLMDGDGLQLRIATDGKKTWLVRYMFDGKERQYRLPKHYGDGLGQIGLKEAREQASYIRSLARENIDIQIKLDNELQEVKRDQEIQLAQSKTLNDLFDAWVQTVDRKDGGKELQRTFKSDVLPVAGDLMLKEVMPDHIERMLRRLVAREANRAAVMLFADLKQMFRWASRKRAWKHLIDDPTEEVALKKEILPSGYEGSERHRTLSEGEVQELATKLPKSGLAARTQTALWIMLSCCCRIGEVIQATWAQIDFDTGVWTIPKENSKNKKAHVVFLSPFAATQFKALKRIATNDIWCFPDTSNSTHVCIKSATKQVKDRQLAAGRTPMKNRTKNSDALLLKNGNWVPHDLRRTGATLMQSLKIAPHVIEKVLNHIEPNKLRRTYQQYDYANEKREAWASLGELLNKLVPHTGS